MAFFPLGSFSQGLFSGASNTVQLMSNIQDYQFKANTEADRIKLINQAASQAATPSGGSGLGAQPPIALNPSAPVSAPVTAPPPSPVADPNSLPTLYPPGQGPTTATPTVTAPETPAPAAPAPIKTPAPQYDDEQQAPPPPPAPATKPAAQPAPAAPNAKPAPLGGTASGSGKSAQAGGPTSYSSDAPLTYLPPQQFTAQVTQQAAQPQPQPRSPVVALAGAGFPTVGSG